jgi:hypothetical protein
MTSIFDENGNIPCTVMKLDHVVTKSEPKVLTVQALQLGFDDKNEHSTKAALGHFKRGTS